MTYELDRAQKERRLLFEEEMQRRMQYLDAVNELNNWSYYFMHLHNPLRGSHREGTNYTRVEVGRENSSVVGHTKDQLHSHSLEAKT